MCGLAINIASFAHLLKRVDFDAIVDHLAIMYIMISKMEHASNRIKRLLELLTSYSFNLYYMKGKDMILSDFLSRQYGDDSDPHQIIRISFNIKEIQKENYQNIVKKTYRVQTSSQTKDKAANAPAVKSTTRKPVTQNITPRIDKTPDKTSQDTKPNINTQTQPQDTGVKQKEWPQGLVGPGKIPISMHPIVRLPPKPQDTVDKRETPSLILVQNPNLDFEKNLSHQEGIITEMYVSPDQSYIKEPQELSNLVNTSKLVQKYLPRQVHIDKILDIIKRKVLKGTHLPLTIKEIQAGYLTRPFFKDLYRYLAQNIMPNKRHARCKVEALSESFVLLDSLLFKLITVPDREKALLAIPEICADKIIELYHTSLFAGHQGVIKTYLTISNKFFIPNLMHYLRSFLKVCHICQLSRNDKPASRQLETKISLNYIPMSRLSMDLKVMPRSQKGHRYILCIIDEMTNYLITTPLYQARSEEVGEALIENVISKFGTPEYMMMDQDSMFMSSLMSYLFKKLGISVKTVGPYNHQSLQAELGIKSLSSILSKHLTGQGQTWHKFLSLAAFAYNIFHTPNLGNYSLYELVFGRKPKILLNIETDPDIKISVTYKDYHTLLTKMMDYLQNMLQNFKMKCLALLNKDREYFQYNSGDLVYLISPLTTQLRTISRKVAIRYVGPLVMYKIVDPHNYLLMTIDGILFRGLFEHEMLKPAVIGMDKGNVTTLSALKGIMNLAIST